MNDDRLTILIEKHLNDSCTPDERQELEGWYESHEANKIAFYQGNRKAIDAATKRSLVTLRRTIGINKGGMYVWWKMAAAAVLLIALASGIYVYQTGKYAGQNTSLALMNDVSPGGNRAVLKTANGQMINLDPKKKVIVVKDKTIQYADGTKIDVQAPNDSSINFNLLMTPKGGRYQVILPDGTKVWLNAGSSLKYPPVFSTDSRLVELEGEAFFSVSNQRSRTGTLRPFIVRTKMQDIRVLGTDFNVMAYISEKYMATTLVNGAVGIQLAGSDVEKILHPGQQARTETNKRQINVADVDVEEVISWKDNYFKFTDENIRDIMAKLSRWYDVNVVYDEKLDFSGLYFSGTVSNSKSLREALRMMERTENVHFKIEGREVIVMP